MVDKQTKLASSLLDRAKNSIGCAALGILCSNSFCLAQSIDLGPDPQKAASELLHGKVEERDKTDRLGRPRGGDPLGKSVKVLSGQSALNGYTSANGSAPLEGGTQDESLDSALKMDNFNLPLQKMTPKSDYNAENSVNADLRSGRFNGYRNMNSMSQGFAWGVGSWSINGWGINDSGINNWAVGNSWGINNSYNNYYSADWNNRMIAQQRLRADLISQGGNMNWNPSNTALSGQMHPVPIPMQDWGIKPMSAAPALYADQNILWDAWYQKVSDALYRNWVGLGQQPGEAKIRIYVRTPRSIQAQILHCSNQTSVFKSNLMSAVAKLNGSPVLDFPASSQKQLVSFDTLFTADTNTVSGAYSERSGELEHVRIRSLRKTP